MAIVIDSIPIQPATTFQGNVKVKSGGGVGFQVQDLAGATTYFAISPSSPPLTTYNNIPTAGNGLFAIVASGRQASQTGAIATLAGYPVPAAADASYYIAANVRALTATSHSFNVNCTYTDDFNAVQILNLPFKKIGSTLINIVLANTDGTVAFHGIGQYIRAKAGTGITISTSGTFQTVTYHAESIIAQIA